MKFKSATATILVFITAVTLQIPALAAVTVPADLAVVSNVAVRPSTSAPYLNGTLTVSWDASPDALQYTVLASRIGTAELQYVSVGKESTQAVVDRLVGGASYIVQVRVIGNGRVSPWTTNTLTSVPTTVPNAPAQPSVKPEVGAATVNWVGLIGNESGGLPVTEYKITEIFSNTTIRAADTDSSAKITGLTEGASASFTVSAITSASPDGIPSVASTPVTILASKVNAPDGGQSQDASGGQGIGGGGSGGGGGGGVIPTPTLTPTPIPTPSPSVSENQTPIVTPISSPTPMPSPLVSENSVPNGKSFKANSYFEIDKSAKKPFSIARINNTVQTIKIAKGKSLKLIVGRVSKGANLRAAIKIPNGKNVSFYSMKSKKLMDLKIPTLKFKKVGTFVLTVSFAKTKRVITIRVSNAGVKAPAAVKNRNEPITVVCTNGKIDKKITATTPVCPAGFHRK